MTNKEKDNYVPFCFDTSNLVTSGAKLASWRHNGVERRYIDRDFNVHEKPKEVDDA